MKNDYDGNPKIRNSEIPKPRDEPLSLLLEEDEPLSLLLEEYDILRRVASDAYKKLADLKSSLHFWDRLPFSQIWSYKMCRIKSEESQLRFTKEYMSQRIGRACAKLYDLA